MLKKIKTDLFRLLLGAPFLLIGCTHSLHMVYVSDTPREKFEASQSNISRFVEAQAEQFVFLGLAFNTQYIDECKTELLSRCKNGSVVGITTEYWSSHGFFSWTNKVRMQGKCIPKN